MTREPRSIRRRSALAALIGVPAGLAVAGQARPAPGMVEEATLMVAGPDGGVMDSWARRVQPALVHGLPPGTTLGLGHVGGHDGVTGANHFAVHGYPDGRTLLMAPGEAAIAWLVGDPRAKFDLGRWTALLLGVAPAVLMLRRGVDPRRRPVRLAMPGIATGALAGLIALEIMGGRPEPVGGIGVDQQVSALATGGVDAVLVRGHLVVDQVAGLAQAGAVPLMVMGAERDPALPAIPAATEVITEATPMAGALAATTAATQVVCAVALPQLTPAARVAVWRQAAAGAVQALDLQSFAMSMGARVLAGPDAAAIARPVIASANSLRALRGWLAERYRFKPG